MELFLPEIGMVQKSHGRLEFLDGTRFFVPGAKINCQSVLLCGGVLGWTSPVIFMGLLWPEVQPLALWGWGCRALPHCGFTAVPHLPSPVTPRLCLGYENIVVIHHRVFFCHPQPSLAQEGVICSPFNFTCKLDHVQRLSPSSFAKRVIFCWQIQEQICVEEKWLYPATRKGGGMWCLNTAPPFLKTKPQA